MMRLSRLALAAVLATTLTVPAARAAQPDKAQPPKALEPDKLLPADADTIVYVNFKQILEAGVIKKYALDQINQALAGQDAKKLLEEMGLDPMKDIEKIWVGMSGSGREDMKALVAIHGKFDPEKLEKAATAISKKDGDKFSVIKDGAVMMFKYQPEDGNPIYAAVVGEKTVIAGSDKKLIATAMEQSKSDKKAPIKAELTSLIKSLKDDASVVAVSLVKGKLDGIAGGLPDKPIDLSGVGKALPKADTLSIVVKITADVSLEVVFGMKDEDSAEDMDAALAKLITDLGGFVPVLVALDPKAKPLADIVKTLKAKREKKNVTVTGKIPGDTIGDLIAPAAPKN